MSQIKWVSAYEPIPQALEYRVRHTLEHLDDALKTHAKAIAPHNSDCACSTAGTLRCRLCSL